ncbi:hypothetical protein [uncultured Nonlabens sp.]|uniref:hypothetical protein n=1 Tax=uncultured Nonlabens sp. TaxID=859306 RepID=UPI00260631D8|nr:hypothetical protein [uncultured Nonlabens sp.]
MKNIITSLIILISLISCKDHKEALESFSIVRENQLLDNDTLTASNLFLMSQIENKAMTQPDKYAQIYSQSLEFHDKVTTLKNQLTEVITAIHDHIGETTDYSKMEDNLDNLLFNQDGTPAATGEKIIEALTDFNTTTQDQLFFYPVAEKIMKEHFTIATIKNLKGKEITYLDYHFKGYPAIATIAKITTLQNNALQTENQFLRELIENPEH